MSRKYKPPIPRPICCANCHRDQPDYGRGATCDYCGCSPLPSYAYPEDSAFHPEHCGCTNRVTPNAQLRLRKTQPSLAETLASLK